MDNLSIGAPEKLSDNSFKININGQDYEYQISEEKDIDASIDKITQWLDRGEDSYGGLYDYIKRTFKLIGEYEEPLPEPIEEESTEVDLPSEQVDVDEPVENQLDINMSIDEEEVSITLNDWSAKFQIINDVEDFTDRIADVINEEMTLKDRTELIIQLAKELEANDVVDFYNLFNLILDTGVDIVNSFDEVKEDTPEEVEDIDNLDVLPDEEQNEEGPEHEIQEESENLTEDFYDENTGESVEEDKWALEDLIINEDFINNLITLDLSLFEIVSKESGEKIYFVGGINDIGNKFTLSYTTKEPIEIIDGFDKIKELPECLNNIEDLDTVVDYIDKLLNIYYNKKMKDMEDDNE